MANKSTTVFNMYGDHGVQIGFASSWENGKERNVDLSCFESHNHDKSKRDNWIPVEEKMPEPYETVLVTRESPQGTRRVVMGWTDGKNWHPLHVCTGKIIAWMPIPKAYEP